MKEESRNRAERGGRAASAARLLAPLGADEPAIAEAVLALADLAERGALPMDPEAKRPDPRWSSRGEGLARALARLEAAGLAVRDARGWDLTKDGRCLWMAVRALM